MCFGSALWQHGVPHVQHQSNSFYPIYAFHSSECSGYNTSKPLSLHPSIWVSVPSLPLASFTSKMYILLVSLSPLRTSKSFKHNWSALSVKLHLPPHLSITLSFSTWSMLYTPHIVHRNCFQHIHPLLSFAFRAQSWHSNSITGTTIPSQQTHPSLPLQTMASPSIRSSQHPGPLFPHPA